MIATLLASVVLAQGYYSPEEARQLFDQGNAAYERAQYDEAIAAWEKLATHGFDSQDVLYNLGTAALKKGDLGHAVLYLERARRAGPDSEDLLANLAAARARQGDQIVGANDEPFVQRVAAATPRDLVALGFLGAWLGGFGMVFLFRRLVPGRRTWAGLLAGVLLAASVPLGLLLAAHVYVTETVTEAVVLAPTVRARELPAPNAKVSFEVHAGLKVRVLGTEGGFVRIRLPNGLVGWIEKEGIAEI